MRAMLPFFLAIGLATAGACGRTASFSEWPTRPVKVIVPFGPGSGADIVMRLVAPLFPGSSPFAVIFSGEDSILLLLMLVGLSDDC